MNTVAAYAENITLICCATFLAHAWDSGWPFLLLLMCNSVRTRVVKGSEE